ncbi:MAG TPA: hypothetical protein VEC19_09990 [Usitatibacter sp.]|nr:hypothetical protein [Usitatibacter sp.]
MIAMPRFIRIRFTDGARNRSRHQMPASGGMVKELSLEEVLRIAGGLPLSAALDEITYHAQLESACGPVDRARLLGKDPPSSEPV